MTEQVQQLKYAFLEAKRGFFAIEIPLWTAVVSLTGLATILAGVSFYFQKINYPIRIPGVNAETINLEYGAIAALSNSNYFAQVKDSFVAQKTSFVEANLSDMKLSVYEDGILVKEVPIKTKGKEGSWWETPAGVYKIETREQNHFSSIGHVYQPWSMQFQGNFFIHGWPYYEDGSEVSSTYSGGCIRLATEDAKAVFDLVKIGTPVLVYEQDFTHDSFTYSQQQPHVTAQKYLVADLKSDSVLFAKGMQDEAPIGSLTKLLNALVAAEYINLDKTIYISSSVLETTTKPRLRAGQEISVYNLMFPLLMEDSNEAASAIARQLGKSRFVTLMNNKAVSVGMKKTSFADVTGVSPENTSTPEDLFALAKYLHNNRSFILKMSAGKISSSIYGDPIFNNLSSIHIPANTTSSFAGGILDTAHTETQAFLGTFNVTIQNQDRTIAVILLNSTDAEKDAKAMLEYVHLMYK
jgi:hypothetical protein